MHDYCQSQDFTNITPSTINVQSKMNISDNETTPAQHMRLSRLAGIS